MAIAHCSTNSFQGNYLSGWDGYQAVENYPYESLDVWQGCGDPNPGWSLTGDVPPGLVPETPSSNTTKLIANPIGTIFDDTVWKQIIETYDPHNLSGQTIPIPNSDQGGITIVPRQCATTVTRTYNFTLHYDGIDSTGAPCTSDYPLTLIVLVDWSAQANKAEPTITARITGDY